MLLSYHPRGHMLLEAMVGGAILAFTMASLVSSLNQSSANVGQALKSQQAMQVAEAQIERLRRIPLTSFPWTNSPPVPPYSGACPHVEVGITASATPDKLVVPGAQWQCTLQIEDISVAVQPSTLLPGGITHKRATVTVRYQPGAGGREIVVSLVAHR